MKRLSGHFTYQTICPNCNLPLFAHKVHGELHHTCIKCGQTYEVNKPKRSQPGEFNFYGEQLSLLDLMEQ